MNPQTIELALLIANTEEFYRKEVVPVEKNLTKKVLNRTYRQTLAYKSFHRLVNQANKFFNTNVPKEQRDELANQLEWAWWNDTREQLNIE